MVVQLRIFAARFVDTMDVYFHCCYSVQQMASGVFWLPFPNHLDAVAHVLLLLCRGHCGTRPKTGEIT